MKTPLETRTSIRRIAFVGDYLPRKCGIATFTSDLLTGIANEFPDCACIAVPVNDVRGGYDYPDVVRFEIEQEDIASYQRAAAFLNVGNVDVVCVQHEFGIYGGPAGRDLLVLLRDLRMPVVTTLHTVLADPSPEQRRVMHELIARSSRLVVMSERGRQMLESVYQTPAGKIDLIPHGIPDVSFVDPENFKEQFGVEGRRVLLTFGLLSPNKGIEHALNALPAIIADFPDTVYIVVGATHPNEQRENGESYRLGLERLARKNKVLGNVIFYNRFVELDELNEFIGAADLYITPYLNEAQSTSGALAYAFGAGKVVISTPYWHAAELLADDRGVLVPFADPRAISDAVLGLLRDDDRRNAMRANAHRLGREMIWSHTAQLYRRSFEQAKREQAAVSRKSFATKTLEQQSRELPTLTLDHLSRMTDSTGMFQHAVLNVPNYSEGYCTDDNARAFILAVLLDALDENQARVRSLGTVYAAFLQHAFDPASGRFHSHMSFDRRWLDGRSEDCHGRALWALGTAAGRSTHRGFRVLAAQLFGQALPVVAGFTSPRAWAFTLLGIHEYLRRMGGERSVQQMREVLTGRLEALLAAVKQPDWIWFEDVLTYDNAKLSHALITSGHAMERPEMVERGLETLRWLMEVQTSENDHFRPIGSNGWWRRGGPRATFDQQPVDAHASVSACLAAYRMTSDAVWLKHAQRAFDWFLGWNDLGLELYSPTTGGCRDALHSDRVNSNEGAESTLAFLMALAEMRMMQNALTHFNEPAP